MATRHRAFVHAGSIRAPGRDTRLPRYTGPPRTVAGEPETGRGKIRNDLVRREPGASGRASQVESARAACRKSLQSGGARTRVAGADPQAPKEQGAERRKLKELRRAGLTALPRVRRNSQRIVWETVMMPTQIAEFAERDASEQRCRWAAYGQAVVHLAWLRDDTARHLLFGMVELRPLEFPAADSSPEQCCRAAGKGRLYYRRFAVPVEQEQTRMQRSVRGTTRIGFRWQRLGSYRCQDDHGGQTHSGWLCSPF